MMVLIKKGLPKMRIVFIYYLFLDTSLYARAQMEIMGYMAERGHEVFLIAAHSKKRYPFKNSKIHIFSIPVGNILPFISYFIFTVVLFFSLPFYLVKLKPDFIVTDNDGIFGLMSTLPFSRLIGVKVVLDIRSTPTPITDVHRKAGLHEYLMDLAFNTSVYIAKKKLDGITIITSLMKKEICNKFHIEPSWIGVWSSGASTKLFRYEKYVQDGIELRKKLGLTNKFIVCYHGAFSQSRGLMDAIDAMSMLKNRCPEVVLFLLGTGSTQTIDDMRKLIQKNELQDKVIIHDVVDYVEVPKYIAMCDVGIVPLPDLPQWRHQCPLKLVEYLAMKKVVLLTDIPCHREIVGNKKCGIYIPSTNPPEIARSIEYAYDNKERLKKWGASGRVIVNDKYNWEKAAEDLENYLRWVKNK
jgi:glycosyltransferase involved in cell wall biosynthesis